ncbi:hypothetical protein FA15DRAFT_654676 [Coprinopsis marcescibilis]|nr:hypothetical protein FA15DRAFT_654676 [Coprinopsis marcescibilis]
MDVNLLLNPVESVTVEKPGTEIIYYEPESLPSQEEVLYESAQHETDEDEPMYTDLLLNTVPEPVRVGQPNPEETLSAAARHEAEENEPMYIKPLLNPMPEPVTVGDSVWYPIHWSRVRQKRLENLLSEEEALSAAIQLEADENEVLKNVTILCGWVSSLTGQLCNQPIRGDYCAVQAHIKYGHKDDNQCRWEVWVEERDRVEVCQDLKLNNMTFVGKHVFRNGHILRGRYTDNPHLNYEFKNLKCGGCCMKFNEYVRGKQDVLTLHAAKDQRTSPRCTEALNKVRRLRKVRKAQGAPHKAVRKHRRKGGRPL